VLRPYYLCSGRDQSSRYSQGSRQVGSWRTAQLSCWGFASWMNNEPLNAELRFPCVCIPYSSQGLTRRAVCVIRRKLLALVAYGIVCLRNLCTEPRWRPFKEAISMRGWKLRKRKRQALRSCPACRREQPCSQFTVSLAPYSLSFQVMHMRGHN
jgi:hypothetical protein